MFIGLHILGTELSCRTLCAIDFCVGFDRVLIPKYTVKFCCFFMLWKMSQISLILNF